MKKGIFLGFLFGLLLLVVFIAWDDLYGLPWSRTVQAEIQATPMNHRQLAQQDYDNCMNSLESLKSLPRNQLTEGYLRLILTRMNECEALRKAISNY